MVVLCGCVYTNSALTVCHASSHIRSSCIQTAMTGGPSVLEVCRRAMYQSAPSMSMGALHMPCLHVRMCMIVARPDKLMLCVIICSMPDLHCIPVAWAAYWFCAGKSVPVEKYFSCCLMMVLFANSCHIIGTCAKVLPPH